MTSCEELKPDSETGVIFWYKNHRGEEAYRHVRPITLWWGSTEYHPEQQWLLKAYDLEKNVERDFALRDARHMLSTQQAHFHPAQSPQEAAAEDEAGAIMMVLSGLVSTVDQDIDFLFERLKEAADRGERREAVRSFRHQMLHVAAAEMYGRLRSASPQKVEESEVDEAYEIGKRDGYEDAVQELDIFTGGDGEFRGSTLPGGTVDVPTMMARVKSRIGDAMSYADLRASGGLFPSQEKEGSTLCEGCPPVGYPTDKTRCTPCPRRSQEEGSNGR